MKFLRSTVVATSIALALGSQGLHAEICLGMACMYNHMTPQQAIDATLVQINEALKSVDNQSGDEAIIKNIKEALSASKEINANDKLDRNRNRANEYLKKARTAVKDGDLNKAKAELKESEKRFADLKGMLELTQEDRTSQQTHMLTRILDKSGR